MSKAAVFVKGRRVFLAAVLALALSIAGFAAVMAGSGTGQAGDGASANLARLHQLQADFHHAATSGAPGEENPVDQRVQDVISLFTDDATLTFGPTTYVGSGKDSCDEGTICDFFANVAPTFVEANRWVSLSPAYKTSFEIHGNTAEVYFECHFFGPNWETNPPPHLAVNAIAKKVGNRWLFSEFVTTPAEVPFR